MALKRMRNLLKKYGFVPDKLVTDDLRSYGPQFTIWEFRITTSEVDGVKTEPRTPINRPGDENARCSVSRARAQPRDSFPLTQPLTIPSTSSAI